MEQMGELFRANQNCRVITDPVLGSNSLEVVYQGREGEYYTFLSPSLINAGLIISRRNFLTDGFNVSVLDFKEVSLIPMIIAEEIYRKELINHISKINPYKYMGGKNQ